MFNEDKREKIFLVVMAICFGVALLCLVFAVIAGLRGHFP